MNAVRRLLVAAYLIEAGLLLIVAPWTASWQHNYFGAMLPVLSRIMANEFVRGGVSGVGVITAFGGLRELIAALSRRSAMHPQSSAPTRELP
jgi:hypothetical protein